MLGFFFFMLGFSTADFNALLPDWQGKHISIPVFISLKGELLRLISIFLSLVKILHIVIKIFLVFIIVSM